MFQNLSQYSSNFQQWCHLDASKSCTNFRFSQPFFQNLSDADWHGCNLIAVQLLQLSCKVDILFDFFNLFLIWLWTMRIPILDVWHVFLFLFTTARSGFSGLDWVIHLNLKVLENFVSNLCIDHWSVLWKCSSF